MSNDRPPAAAGLYYPNSPDQLSSEIDRCLNSSPARDLSGELIALLVPHAGVAYSGTVAGEAFRHVGHEWDRVVLLGPAHRVRVEGAALWARGSFETPLGRVPIDEALADELLSASPLFQDQRDAHREEHSLEVELPFLQKTADSCKILPILLNSENPETCRQIGEAFGQVLIGKKALIVISSDLSHYPDRKTARRVDRASLAALKRMDADFLHRTSQVILERGEPELFCTFCGEAALLAGLEAAKVLGADHMELLRYANSADCPEGDPDRVVGYAAAAFVRTGRNVVVNG